jgi:hypothetical protein
MSLAGNISDLALAELLQLVAMSRKSGSLEICSEHGVAWLGLSDGGIVRVALDDGKLDRGQILKSAGLVDSPDAEAVESTLWDAAVRTIVQIFEWDEGEFTFEPLDDPTSQWRGPEGIILPTSLSPEFLALEGARREDESGQGDADCERQTPCGDSSESWDLDDEAASDSGSAGAPGVVICVDDSLELLEQIKEAFHGTTVRIHIFQSPDDALGRFKHYLVRGQYPALVIGSGVRDPLDAKPDAGWTRFAARVRTLAPATPVVVLGPADLDAAPDTRVLVRPDHRMATADDVSEFLRQLEDALGLPRKARPEVGR